MKKYYVVEFDNGEFSKVVIEKHIFSHLKNKIFMKDKKFPIIFIGKKMINAVNYESEKVEFHPTELFKVGNMIYWKGAEETIHTTRKIVAVYQEVI